MEKTVASKCHCGSVELELTLPMGLRIFEDAIVQFVAEGTRSSPQWRLIIWK